LWTSHIDIVTAHLHGFLPLMLHEVALQPDMSFVYLVLPEDGYRLQPKHAAVV